MLLKSIVAIIFLSMTPSPSWGQSAQELNPGQRQSLQQSSDHLHSLIDVPATKKNPEWTDAAIFAKGLAWGLKYDHEFSPADIGLMEKAIRRAGERLAALSSGTHPWTNRRGKIALGYQSTVDSSVQPYGVVVPKGYDPATPIRLDVVLHGSSRPVGMSELRFMERFDEGDGENAAPPDAPYIELHPLGRVENCYRWSGETDVFEAIADVCRRYNIDGDRIVLRGMSMGASGTWHLGLKHPDRFVALGPYCGYVDTHRFSETPIPGFVRVGPLPEHQELGLHMLDSVDYAANAGVVPAIGCIGEKDVFFQAHELMSAAMKNEGLTMINLISPGTGHVIDPVTHAEQMRQIAEHVARGGRSPTELRFVTWTLKYGRCHWLQILGLQQHYARAELSARIKDDLLIIDEPRNVTRFAIVLSDLPAVPTRLKVGTTELSFPGPADRTDDRIVLVRERDQWHIDRRSAAAMQGQKRPGMQGPIDDAFTSALLCVRGTGEPWNAGVQSYADASLKRFADEWQHYFRGELPIKNDVDVTEDDIRTRNLILFGDPGSNSLIAKCLPQLPLDWSRDSLKFGGKPLSAADHVPVLIAPNPLATAGDRYVVLNSGHTFREADLSKFNYLLFPRWGDYAVLKLDLLKPATDPLEDQVLRVGYFDESWQVPRTRD